MQKQTKIEMSNNGTYVVVVVGEFSQVDMTFGHGLGSGLSRRNLRGKTFVSHLSSIGQGNRPESLSDNWVSKIDELIQQARDFRP